MSPHIAEPDSAFTAAVYEVVAVLRVELGCRYDLKYENNSSEEVQSTVNTKVNVRVNVKSILFWSDQVKLS